jgi:methyl-accepting chemotaxis protein
MSKIKWGLNTSKFSLSQKILIAPAIATLFVIIISLVGTGALIKQNSALGKLTHRDFFFFKQSYQVLTNIRTLHMQLYTLITWTSTNYEKTAIDDLTAEFNSLRKDTSDKISKFQRDPRLNTFEKKSLEQIAKDYANYQENAFGAVDIMSGDVGTATLYVSTAQDAFNTLNSILNKLLSYEDQRTQEESKRSSVALSLNILLFIILSTAAAIISWWVAIRMSRWITRPIVCLEETMHAVNDSGTFEHRVEVMSEDETGSMSKAFNQLMEGLESTILGINTAMSGVIAGELNPIDTSQSKGAFHLLQKHVNETIRTLNNVIANILEIMQDLAMGNFKLRLNLRGEGVYQEMETTANQALSSLESIMNEIMSVMTAMAGNDLTFRINGKSSGELERLKQNINQSLDMICESMRKIQENSLQLNKSATETNASIEEIASSTGKQASSIGNIARSIQLAEETIQETVHQSRLLSDRAGESGLIISRGQTKMDEMGDNIKAVADSSHKIIKITEVIGGIANQTNLLSLNAAIEAARAGEHGKGFAVVADEVRKLAEHSSESVQEISDLIDKTIKQISAVVKSSEIVQKDMTTISQNAAETEVVMGQISNDIDKQQLSLESISHDINTVTHSIEENASASEEITAISNDVALHMKNLKEQVMQFKI